MSKPLREGISEFVIDYVQAKRATGEAIDAAEIAYEIAQSLIDIIMTEEAEGQASLFALVLAGTRRRIPPSERCTGCWAQNCQLGCRPDRNQNQLVFLRGKLFPPSFALSKNSRIASQPCQQQIRRIGISVCGVSQIAAAFRSGPGTHPGGGDHFHLVAIISAGLIQIVTQD